MLLFLLGGLSGMGGGLCLFPGCCEAVVTVETDTELPSVGGKLKTAGGQKGREPLPVSSSSSSLSSSLKFLREPTDDESKGSNPLDGEALSVFPITEELGKGGKPL
jgi:hypothetical protein